MNKHKFLHQKGFTLVEMVIAAGIMTVVVFGGFKAFEYFNSQTKKEAKKMDDISEFNALTKDLVSFTEGAGISTFYLNLPIKTQGCNETEPCVRELTGEKFVAPTSAIPSNLSNTSCMQFYKDAKGQAESKIAYPGKSFVDKIWGAKDLELTLTQELYATWVLKDTNSPPFLMMKSRDSSLYLNQLSDRFQLTVSNYGLNHAFYESDSSKEALLKLQGYPFLTYNSLMTNQYLIQYAVEIISCEDQKDKCVTLMKKTDPGATSDWSDSAIAFHTGTSFPSKVFAIEFKPVDFNEPYFKDIFDRQSLPENCLTKWGDGKQATSGSFFPSSSLSISSTSPDPAADAINMNPVNQLFLNKHTFDRSGKSQKGSWVTLPIDIITYRVEQATGSQDLQIISQMWHPTEIKKKIKIHQLKAPFILTRKLGTPEMGIWYNPIKKNTP